MSRRRVASALLAFVALWPFVTLWLQARWDVDPWKLMSFGMYAAPGRRPADVRLAMTVQRGEAWEPVAEAEVPAEAAAFLEWRRTLGRLASPAALGRALLARAGATRARIEVRELRLDAKTARVQHQVEVLELP